MDHQSQERLGRVIVWFRRDLRPNDHPALVDAVASGAEVIPLFVLDERLLGQAASTARTWFLKRSLLSLDAALRSRGSGLLLRTGRPEELVPSVADEFGAGTVMATRDVTPFAHRRDAAVSTALERQGRRLLLRPGLLLVEPEQLLSASGEPYRVFTPFWRALQRAPRRGLLEAPSTIPTPAGVVDGSVGRVLATDDLEPPMADLPAPGEAAAAERLHAWVNQGLAGYAAGRNELAGDATSHLGADLHLGLLSPRQVEEAAIEAATDATAFVRQLAWREFYHHQLFHRRTLSSRAADGPLMAAFRSETEDPAAVAAWHEGRTGIPVVDAAMRQLAATGWMSNRARLVVASFLTRHLLIDYRVGERHFLRHLIDGDVANNLGGWQWTAGVGADPQPWFRIFNPVLQGRRFDPDGVWVRRWVPELAGIPDRFVHAPWEMPPQVAADAGFEPGLTYPKPIVDLKVGRERALVAFRTVTGNGSS
jgi:deoxyribodipyrimidine photo-lyase